MGEKNNSVKRLADVLELFKDTVTPEELVEAALNAKISTDITQIRLSMKLTQKEFAEKLGIKQSQVSRWENGSGGLSIKTLAKITAAFDLVCDISLRRHGQMAWNRNEPRKSIKWVPKDPLSNFKYLSQNTRKGDNHGKVLQ